MADPETHEERLAALMRSAHGGDADAYAALMQELAVRLRQIVRHRRAFLEHADVEDLVQDVLLSVHAVRATYDVTRPFLPWVLCRAVANRGHVCGDRVERRRGGVQEGLSVAVAFG
jgi:DNA-directed RNA polymerase specialized sigma24 family protein